MANIHKTHFIIEGIQVPVKIHKENRNNARVSIGQKEILIRLPQFLTYKKQTEQISTFEIWANNIFKKKPTIKERFISKTYQSGQLYKVGNYEYTLQFILKRRKSLKATITNNIIEVKLPFDLDKNEKATLIGKILSKVIANHQSSNTKERIHYLNKHFFGVNIKSIGFKYNTSNWGSCSSKGNINISSRLLFAPLDVQDYVFIHELSHFFEMNHSSRFWKIVSDIMPDYKEKERWLKLNSHQCNY